ncbi:hypothetical protein HPB50_019732 [Hyalomma asiaticum]|uniref:Uncharacterized protein n=1 Tax=Hyalomma asiaticum TaxID=266040 RepID=A0ACB7TRP2_HYAAI|nr:hypothetical protein HPB50_019732 [Hyalomma asiaticum]
MVFHARTVHSNSIYQVITDPDPPSPIMEDDEHKRPTHYTSGTNDRPPSLALLRGSDAAAKSGNTISPGLVGARVPDDETPPARRPRPVRVVSTAEREPRGWAHVLRDPILGAGARRIGNTSVRFLAPQPTTCLWTLMRSYCGHVGGRPIVCAAQSAAQLRRRDPVAETLALDQTSQNLPPTRVYGLRTRSEPRLPLDQVTEHGGVAIASPRSVTKQA